MSAVLAKVPVLNLPAALTAQRNWLVWRLVDKPTHPGARPAKPSKIPFYVSGSARGAPDTDHDRQQLCTFDEATACVRRSSGHYAGVGFAVLNGCGLVALDFDNCVADGAVDPRVEALCYGTYSEISPSGTGVRAFYAGALPSNKDAKGERGPFPLEVFGDSGFVTVTGDVTQTCSLFGWDETVAPLPQSVVEHCAARGWSVGTSAEPANDEASLLALTPRLGWTLEEARRILFACPAETGRQNWLYAGMALHHEFEGRSDALDLYDEWSATAPESYSGRRDVEGRWRSFGRATARPITAKWLLHWCKGFLPGDADDDADDDGARSDVHLSRRLCAILSGRFLFEHGGRGWLIYRGGAWLPCTKGEALEEAKKLGLALLREGADRKNLDPDAASRITKLVNRAMSAAGITAALKLAESDPRICAAPDEFDRDPDLLNVANGVIHLPTLELRPHDPAQRLSRQCPVQFEADAAAPTFMRFLREVSCNDPEWIDFMHRSIGYTLWGNVVEEVMFFLLGQGANGKSVLGNLLRRILGTYSTAVPASFLAPSTRDSEAATPALATLPGVRLASANEVESGTRLSAQTVKVVASTEAISARHLHGRNFMFVPSHTLWVRANHKPIVVDNDDGIWRRLVLVPFDKSFAPHERDTALEEKLMAEAPGILAWMVRGYLEYRSRGLKPLGRIASASAAYRKESDLLGQWIDEEAEVGTDFDVVQADAVSSYRQWCEGQGVRAISKKSLTRGLEERGFRAGQRGSGARERTYRGFRLSPDVGF